MIIGHDKVLDNLKHLAECDALSHAYLFFGPPMVGKWLAARKFAEYLEHGAHATLNLEPRTSNILLDALFIEPNEERTIGIDEVRTIRNFLSQRPNVSRYRTVVIRDGEALTTEAQNALLKIAEEPPSSALVILVMHDPDHLLATLHSRFQRVYFGPVQTELIRQWLIEEAGCAQKEAEALVRGARGLPGLALRRRNDAAFRETEANAAKFFELRGAALSNFLKEFVQRDEFQFEPFLDALTVHLAWQEPRNGALWHRLLELRKNAASYNLNPRLQLEALGQSLRNTK